MLVIQRDLGTKTHTYEDVPPVDELNENTDISMISFKP